MITNGNFFRHVCLNRGLLKRHFKNKLILKENNIKLIKSPAYNKVIIQNVDSVVTKDKAFYLGNF
jgi:calcineurin-like phosphoesterase family protein